MANAIDIMEYLPNSYKTRDEQDYINFLWESFESDYNNAKYPFAFIAYHMLYMSFVYFEVWQIKENRKIDFEKAMVGLSNEMESDFMNAVTPFAFVKSNEAPFFKFFKLLGCDNSKIGTYKKSVDDRNNSSHSNGKILFNDKNIIDRKIDDVLRAVDDIQNHSKPIIEECFAKFLIENNDPDKRQYYDDLDQIREILIHGNYLSQKDIEHLLTFDITTLSKRKNYEAMKSLFETFVENYKTT